MVVTSAGIQNQTYFPLWWHQIVWYDWVYTGKHFHQERIWEFAFNGWQIWEATVVCVILPVVKLNFTFVAD